MFVTGRQWATFYQWDGRRDYGSYGEREEGMRKTPWVTKVIAASLVSLIGLTYINGWAQTFRPITPEALKELIEKKDDNILVVDTQPKVAYKLFHIKGAINFPWAMEISSPGNLPDDKTLVLYCDCPNEEDSLDVAKQLQKWDLINVKILKGGLSQWLKLGYPVEKSDE
jgi:rhodanese-related sulfurtransferase